MPSCAFPYTRDDEEEGDAGVCAHVVRYVWVCQPMTYNVIVCLSGNNDGELVMMVGVVCGLLLIGCGQCRATVLLPFATFLLSAALLFWVTQSRILMRISYPGRIRHGGCHGGGGH